MSHAHAILYLTDDASKALIDAALGTLGDAEREHFTRVSGDGADTGYAYTGLRGSTAATTPHVFVLSSSTLTTSDMHRFLTFLPWEHHGGIAIMEGDDVTKIQVKVYGRLTQ